MKRRDLVSRVEKMGCVLIRHSGKHDIYQDPTTGVIQPIPRHREVSEQLARAIIRKLSA